MLLVTETVSEAEWQDGDVGRWLVAHRREMDRGEYGWLEALAAFDMEQGWAADGQVSCVDWLRWKTRMARATSYEKVHLAQQLRVRPAVADAFGDGRISYSAARAICRMDDPDPETDEAMVRLAERGTVRQVEQAVQHYQALADQERPPADPDVRRGVRVRSLLDGWVRVEVTLPELEAQELVAALEAFAAAARRSARADDPAGGGDTAGTGDPGSSVAGDGPVESPSGTGAADAPDADTAGPGPGPGEGAAEPPAADPPAAGSPAAEPAAAKPAASGSAGESARADDEGVGSRPAGASPRAQAWQASRADALLDLARVGLAHADDGHAAGDDRYLVHLVGKDGQFTYLDGTPAEGASAAMVACDTSLVAHTVDEHSEPLSLGRKTRTWTTAQRRAVLVRDGGRCRFPGCERRIVDVHHRLAWHDGGPTDTDNAMAVCRHHHTLLHHGFTTSDDPDGSLHFHRADGTHLGSTHPAHRQLTLAA